MVLLVISGSGILCLRLLGKELPGNLGSPIVKTKQEHVWYIASYCLPTKIIALCRLLPTDAYYLSYLYEPSSVVTREGEYAPWTRSITFNHLLREELTCTTSASPPAPIQLSKRRYL